MICKDVLRFVLHGSRKLVLSQYQKTTSQQRPQPRSFKIQIYTEAESGANELVRFAPPRRYRICGEAEYTQKPRAMQTDLFDLHRRGATVYAAKLNIHRSRERCKRTCSICTAEAPPYKRRSRNSSKFPCFRWQF